MEEENKTVETPVQESKGLSIASMILGIVSVVLFCIWYISVPCAILAIIFGAIENKKNKNNKFSKSGFILGIVGVLISIIFIIVTISMSNSLFHKAKKATKQLEEQILEEQIKIEEELQNKLEGEFKNNTYSVYNFN